MYKTSFKKLTSIVLAVLMLLSVFAVTSYAADTNAESTGGSTVYFDPGQAASDSPVWFAWTWGSVTDQWVTGDASDSSGYVRFDGVGDNMVIVRMPAGSTSPSWDTKWNQSADLSVSDNLATFSSWDNGEGKFTVTWSHYDGGDDPTYQPPTQYTGDTRTILFTDNQGWGSAFVHYFGGSSESTWPGISMTLSGDDGYGNAQFSADVPADSTGLVFNNGSGAQTVDCDIYDGDGIEGFYTTGDLDGEGHYITVSWGSAPTDPTDTEYTYPTEPTQPTETEPAPTATTAPIVTEPSSIQGPIDSTEADENTSFYVSAKSNVNAVGSKVKVSEDTVQVTYTLKTDQKVDDGQFSVSYDSTKLSLNPTYNTSTSMFPVISDAVYNLGAATGVAVFNFSGAEGKYDFTGDGKVLIDLVFQKKSASAVGTATVYLNIFELAANNCTPLIEDSAVKAGANVSVSQQVAGITPTVPTETQAPTSAENNLTINAKSNLTTAVETKVAKNVNVKVTYNLTADQIISYGDATVTYDSSKLALESRYNTSSTMFSTLNSNVSYKLKVSDGVMKFNFTNVGQDHQGTYDFRGGNVLITLMFTIRANSEGSADVNLIFNELGSIDKAYVQDTAVIATGAVVAADVSGEDATQASSGDTEPSIATGETTEPYTQKTDPTQTNPTETQTNPTETHTTPTETQTTPTETQTTPTETQTTPTGTQPTTPTQPTNPTQTQATETQPTGPKYQTSIVLAAEKKTIYVNASTKIYASVTNPFGTTKFKSSNTKVATVSTLTSDICKVVGKKAGTVTITATNNGKVATIKIKVVKRANPMTVKAKTVKAKANKKTVIKKSKAFTIKKAKGKVVFKKVKGDKKITINKKTGKITVKKGLKKGKTYKFKVKVTAKGNTAYKAKSKTVTVKIKVTK
ncbi:MAG: starch-binding protein [Ruminococcus sp.]|nr:starch-binding protein [Ruminococcus sp.]